MKTYYVSAFCANGMGGNPAGVVLDADNLTDQEMLKIAKCTDQSGLWLGFHIIFFEEILDGLLEQVVLPFFLLRRKNFNLSN